MTLFHTQSLLPCFRIHRKQLIDPGHDRAGYRITRIQFDHVGEAPASVRPAAYVDHPRATDFVVGGVGIGLQTPMKVLQKIFGSGSISSHSKVEYRGSAGSSVLPQIRLMMLAAASLLHLHCHRSLVRLEIVALH